MLTFIFVACVTILTLFFQLQPWQDEEYMGANKKSMHTEMALMFAANRKKNDDRKRGGGAYTGGGDYTPAEELAIIMRVAP